MDEFDQRDIRRLDGGLLLIFRELLLRRRATEVADKLGLSQSAVSHALGRLRDLFDDPLFIRRSHGLEPTRRALELGPRVEALIELTAATLSPEGRFDPAQSRRRFSIAGPGFIASLLGAPLVESLRMKAPNASFIWRSLLIDRALNAVRRGDADLAIGQFTVIPRGLAVETLYEDRHAVIARQGHPQVAGEISEADYERLPHVLVGGPASEPNYDADEIEAAYGEFPEPGALPVLGNVTHWESAMLIVSGSDAIADCPRRLAERFAPRLGLQVLEPPYEAMTFRMQMVRRSGRADVGVDWLAAQIRAAAA